MRPPSRRSRRASLGVPADTHHHVVQGDTDRVGLRVRDRRVAHGDGCRRRDLSRVPIKHRAARTGASPGDCWRQAPTISSSTSGRCSGSRAPTRTVGIAAGGARGVRRFESAAGWCGARTSRRVTTSSPRPTAIRAAAMSPRSKSMRKPVLADLVRYTLVSDFGTVINPMLLEGQLHGGIAQGIGQIALRGLPLRFVIQRATDDWVFHGLLHSARDPFADVRLGTDGNFLHDQSARHERLR